MDYDATVWGPSYWGFLHNVAFTYPSHPNDVIRKKYYELVQNLPLFIPHYEIAKDFQELLDLYPIKSYLDNKKSFITWIHFIQNKVNERLDKPLITLEEFYNEFYKKYEKKPSKQFVRTKKYAVYVSLVAIIIFIIIYLYNV
jgi:hypothetical protein